MLRKPLITTHLTCLFCLLVSQAFAVADKLRIMWVDDPSTTAVIGWNQISGTDPVLHLDINDYDQTVSEYAVKRKPDRTISAKGMNNRFVRLKGLKPGTTYYFLIKDSEGVSKQFFFTTAPDSPDERLSIIAGGDSRSFKSARCDANILVAKLRPHCVMFGGDFTESDSPVEWQEWFDDWQLTISADGRMTPIIVTRGNHEESNQTLVDMFDLPYSSAYYAMTLGGDLLRIYTLNSMMPASGEQGKWLENDLQANAHVTWRITQYHHPMRPHTERKAERNDMVVYWAPLFQKYDMKLAVECDAHVVKSTWPLRPDNGPGSEAGFIRDDLSGTVYIGEGCWGAPLRQNNDYKTWTRASGSFNQFHWIFVDKEKIEVRFVQTDGAQRVGNINPGNVFLAPRGLAIWNPPTGDVITIPRPGSFISEPEGEILAARKGYETYPPAHSSASMFGFVPDLETEEDETGNWDACPMLMPDPGSGEVAIKFTVEHECPIIIRLVNLRLKEVTRIELPRQRPGEYLKTLNMAQLPPGRYLAIVKGDRKILRRFRVVKR